MGCCRERKSGSRCFGAVVVIAFAAVALVACGDDGGGAPAALLGELSVDSAEPELLLVGTELTIHGTGFVDATVGELRVRFEGLAAGAIERSARFVDETRIVVTVDEALHRSLEPDVAVRPLKLSVFRQQWSGGVEGAAMVASLGAVRALTPELHDAAPLDIYPGAVMTLWGDGFLQPGEGTTLVMLDGEFTTEGPPSRTSEIQLAVPAAHETRRELRLEMTPDLLAIEPGVFSGTLTVSNSFPGSAVVDGEPYGPLTLDYGRPTVLDVQPRAVRRGQRVVVSGRGFVPADNALEAATLISLAGTFSPAGGGVQQLLGDDTLLLFPDRFEGGDTMEYVLRVNIGPDGEPGGFGLAPGVFEGTISPLLFVGRDSVEGDGLEVTLEVLPQLQVVHVRFMPSFDEALEKFGLVAVRDRIVDRILAVCARDYAGINVRFQADVPEEFEEYSVVEVLGADPNGAGLFGLDNTAGKDVGNLRFNDIVGGVNAETEAAGYYPYGGVFVESFLLFSPTLSGGGNELASPRFEDIFASFVPELGGVPVSEAELAGGGRDEELVEAIRVLGNLVGSTITHEIGHSLGLADIEGNFHNIGDTPEGLMDAGPYRPFAERAEIDGQGPSRFNELNRAYLERILPES